ncbi:MAG: hypothetical protein WC222_11575 [Parachlamydiales bacterium]|jgi:hypothetical protein
MKKILIADIPDDLYENIKDDLKVGFNPTGNKFIMFSFTEFILPTDKTVYVEREGYHHRYSVEESAAFQDGVNWFKSLLQ